MTVCQTCGDKGFTQLLFYCLKCEIVAVHRYCMDGRSTIDDEEISWYCEECVPRVPKPPEPSRKCERVGKTIDREELRSKARRKWKNSSSLFESNKPSNVKDSDVKVTNDSKDEVPSDQQENGNEEITQQRQVPGDLKTNASAISQGKVESSPSQHDPKCLKSLDGIENIRLVVLALKNPEPCNKTTDSEKGRCKPAPIIREKKDLLYGKVVRRVRTKRASSHGDVEDEHVKLEDNVVLAVGDSVSSKDGKHEKPPDEVDSKFTREVNDTSDSRATQHSDNDDQEPEVVEEAIVSVDDHKSEDVQSCCTIRKSCGSRKKKTRSLIIEMEYSSSDDDDEDDTNNSPTVLSPLKSSSSKPPVEFDSDHHAPPINVADYNPIPASPLNLAACVPYPSCISHIVDYVPSQPVIDVIWRGGCVISNNIDPTSFELEAHVSNKASPIVYGTAIALPKIIDFEIISKRYAWPKSFNKSPPTGEIIGLYFFPVGERDEVFYQNLLAKMVDRQLMLMSQINNLELLVFCSHELPEEERRFQRKYYLWGVFRSKKETTSPSELRATQVSNSYLSLLTDTSRDDVYQKPRDSNHRTPSLDNLTHRKRASGSLTYDTRQDRDQLYGSHSRRSYHHEIPPPKFRKHRVETDGDEYDRNTSYQFEVRRHHNYRSRGHDTITFRAVQKDSYRSRGRYRHYKGHERYD